MASKYAVGAEFDIELGPFGAVFDSSAPGAKGPTRLFDAVNMTIEDPANGGPARARHGMIGNATPLGTAGHIGQRSVTMNCRDGSTKRYRFVGGKMYLWDGTNGPAAHTNITPTNVSISTYGTIFCTTYDGKLIVCDEVNQPWIFDPATNIATPIPLTTQNWPWSTKGGATVYAGKLMFIIRAGTGGLLTETVLSRGSTDTQLATTAFTYTNIGTVFSAAAIPAGSVFGALGTLPLGKWAAIAVYYNSGALAYSVAPLSFIGGYAAEADAIAALQRWPLGTVYPLLGYITVQASAGAAWIAGTDALAGGTTGNEAQTTNYYPADGIAGQDTIAWSLELQPLVGYDQDDYDNLWTLTQTSDERLGAISGEEGALVYFRNKGIGTITGAVTTDFRSSATRDSQSSTVGTNTPAAIYSNGRHIWFLDLDGNPYRIPAAGGAPEPLYFPVRRAFETQVSSPVYRSTVRLNARVGYHETYKLILFTIWDAQTLYAFDAITGRYEGTWVVGGAPGTSIAIQSLDAMLDDVGRPTFTLLGSRDDPVSGSGVSGIAWSEKHDNDTAQWLDTANQSAPTTHLALTRAAETTWLTKNGVTSYRVREVAAQLTADTARHAVRLQYVTPSAGLSTAITAQSTATVGEKSTRDSIASARWSTGPNAQGTGVRVRISCLHSDNVRFGIQNITLRATVTEARGNAA